MEKRVPESATTKAEQFTALRDSLAGHQAFRRTRGTGHDKLSDVLANLLDRAQSPSELLRMFDDWTGDLRVLANKLAILRRDGHVDAEDEVMNAFREKGHLLPGETVPLHETSPVTFVIFDPHRMLAMIHWIMAGHWMDLNAHLDGKPCGKLVNPVFDKFPSLRGFTTRRRQAGDYEGWDLLAAIDEDVMKRFRDRTDGMHGYGMAHDTYNNHIELWSGNGKQFGFLTEGEQSDVLKRFDRAEQDLIGTWQFHLPKAFVATWRGGRYGLPMVGFYPEADHERWSKEHQAYVSKGTSHGLGAIMPSTSVRKTLDWNTFPLAREEEDTFRFWLQPGS